MATTYQRTETLRLPAHNIVEMLMSHIYPRKGRLHSTWDVAHSETFITEQGWRAVQIFGFSSAFEAKPTAGKVQYIPFLVKIIELDDFVTEVQIVVSYPLGSFKPDDAQTYPSSAELLHDYRRNVKIAEKLLEFCVTPRNQVDIMLTEMLKRLESIFRFTGTQVEKRKRDV